MNENLKLTMWSPGAIDVENVDLVLDHQRMIKTEPNFEPNPYTFTKLENGKKTTADSSSLSPPSWLLLDHSIAVIWSLFSCSQRLQHLSIDDLKWAYEFLKGIKNKKGENPPDVKVCLKEIQDRLINLYARLTSMKEAPEESLQRRKTQRVGLGGSGRVQRCLFSLLGSASSLKDFDEIAAAFGDKIIEDSTASYINTTFMTSKVESEFDTMSLSSKSKSPLVQKRSHKDMTKPENSKALMNCPKKSYSVMEEKPDLYGGSEAGDDEEVEKYVLSLFEDEKKEDGLQTNPSAKSLIPTKKKLHTPMLTEVASSQDVSCDEKKEKTSKRVHCVAEMRSLKFQKSMKVKDTNGEEAAYSNLKAEIQRLTINPNVSRDDVMKFLKDWRSEQVARLNNELKRLSSIEEFMKTLYGQEVEPNLRMNSQLRYKELNMEKSSWRKRFLP